MPEAKIIYNGKPFLLNKEVITIGREDGSDILLPDPDWVEYYGKGHDEVGVKKEIRTSRKHARILIECGNFIIEDVGSKVGTYVNGEKLGESQPESWEVRYCRSAGYYDYHNQREPKIRERNKGRKVLVDGDVITLGQEMYGELHKLVFRCVENDTTSTAL